MVTPVAMESLLGYHPCGTEIIQETGVGNDEANQLFMFTQWSEMMTEFARTGKTSTVVLPSDFSQSASMFEQMLTAGKVQNGSKE